MKGGPSVSNHGKTDSYSNIVNTGRPAPSTGSIDPCKQDFLAPLQQIDLLALSKIKVGDVFPLIASKTIARIEMYNSEGSFCGTVLVPNLKKMLECIDKGATYEAEVREVSANSCRVNVRNSK